MLRSVTPYNIRVQLKCFQHYRNIWSHLGEFTSQDQSRFFTEIKKRQWLNDWYQHGDPGVTTFFKRHNPFSWEDVFRGTRHSLWPFLSFSKDTFISQFLKRPILFAGKLCRKQIDLEVYTNKIFQLWTSYLNWRKAPINTLAYIHKWRTPIRAFRVPNGSDSLHIDRRFGVVLLRVQ